MGKAAVPPAGAGQGGEPPPAPPGTQEPSVGQITSEFLANTSAHGLPRIIISKGYFRKVLWALVFTGALIYFILQVHGNFSTFYDYPVGVNIEIKRRSV